MKTPTFVIYHAHCPDGFGAAFAAWCALGDEATYLPAQYDEPFPEIPDGARVYIVDFSYPDKARAREALLALDARSAGLVVIDHHKTAAELVGDLPFMIFDMEKSGAVLAWEYFRTLDEPCALHMGEVPALLLYVQDRDLWRWQLPRSREVSAGLALEDRRFSRWVQLVDLGDKGITRLADVGATVLKRDTGLVNALCQGAHERWLPKGGNAAQPVIAVNAPVLQSEVCHELLERHPEHTIAAAYFDKDENTRVWSLRAREGTDASPIAKANGGGGHARACGFTQRRT